MSAFATVNEVILLSGRTFTAAEQERIEALLPLVSDTLRYEAKKAGKDLDAMAEEDTSGAYGNVVKLVTVDIVIRVMRQSFTGDPLTQESQSGLGYSWSGTYTVAGGGIAASILRNDLKRLGLKRQRYGLEGFFDAPARDNNTACNAETDGG